MTKAEATNMLKAKLECLKRETSGTDFDCNNSNCDECSLCYEQGNMGEQEEALVMAIKALEKEPRKGHWIDHSDEGFVECSECGSATNCDGDIADLHFCFSCGAKMIEPQESEE